MQEQGSELLNSGYFDQLNERIANCNSCERLQVIATDALQALNAQKAVIESQITKLAPLGSLLSPPGANPGEIVSWITGLISGLIEPMYQPYLNYQIQLTEQIVRIESIASALSSKASDLPGCEIDLP